MKVLCKAIVFPLKKNPCLFLKLLNYIQYLYGFVVLCKFVLIICHLSPNSDWQSLCTKTISNKDHFVQGRPFRTKAWESLRTRIFCTRWYLEYIFYIHAEESFHTKTISYKDQFVQRRPYKNPMRVNFVFEFLDWVRFF